MGIIDGYGYVCFWVVKVGFCRVEFMLFKVYLYKPNIKSKHTFQIMSSITNMDEEVADSIKSFIETSMINEDY